MLGFLVVTVLTIVSKLQDSSNKHQMDSVRLKYLMSGGGMVDAKIKKEGLSMLVSGYITSFNF
jgi:hypothetical protein